ncbi:MAG: 4Fe-4S binding protein [Oscillospiraceae bacterium]|nr:4Fe-4S binding protein [Oscillospiraceae bacterium]
MIRRIITINQERCNGCGLCASACHEGAIGIVNGKATLLREDYCDGLGDCLPACPMNAISFEAREAPAYNESAVLAAKREKSSAVAHRVESRLNNFPIQIRLAPANAPCFDDADLLIAADCTAFAYGNFHNDFMQNRVTLIGCPKLDSVNYAEKLAEIFRRNNIRSITVTRMTVPCCGGLPFAVKNALALSGKDIPLHIVTIRPDGSILR